MSDTSSLGMAQSEVLLREADLVDAIAACDRASAEHNTAKAKLLRLQADDAAYHAQMKRPTSQQEVE